MYINTAVAVACISILLHIFVCTRNHVFVVYVYPSAGIIYVQQICVPMYLRNAAVVGVHRCCTNDLCTLLSVAK